ncbi:hypothetical protein ACVWW2_000753 [Bradyrhizobium sp. LM4.3]
MAQSGYWGTKFGAARQVSEVSNQLFCLKNTFRQ